jgi:hypothetical protein
MILPDQNGEVEALQRFEKIAWIVPHKIGSTALNRLFSDR